MISRRRFLVVAGGSAVLLALPRALFALAHGTKVTVFGSAARACCRTWAAQLGETGFDVEWRAAEDMEAMKRANRVPEYLWSCHTAFVAGYVIEGHVPAAAIRRLLDVQPPITGLATVRKAANARAAPYGSPDDVQAVLSFNSQGETKAFWSR